MDIEIEIDEKTGEVFLNRDHEVMVKIAKELNPDEYKKFKKFFRKKPLNTNKEKNYNSFCG